VATHPGNRNALKSGVYSPSALAPRVHELEAALAERPARAAAADLLRREAASLAALGEAMDESLATDGIHGRGGTLRTLVSHRLRLNEKIRRTLDAYQQAVVPEESERSHHLPVSEADIAPAQQTKREHQSLADSIAKAHDREQITMITPPGFGPELFLAAIITATDPAVRTDDRLRARRMLTKRKRNRPATCLCTSPVLAWNYLHFQEWVVEAAHAGCTQDRDDQTLAAIVRRIAAGQSIQPWRSFKQTHEAVEEVLTDGVERARGDEEARPDTRVKDPTVSPFWRTLLSRDLRVSANNRLKAFQALDDVGVFPRCKCKPTPPTDLPSITPDAWRAFVIRLMTRQTYEAALYVVQYPETYIAVREAVDARLVEAIGTTGDDSSREAW